MAISGETRPRSRSEAGSARLPDYIRALAAAQPDATAILTTDQQSLSFAGLAAQIDRTANQLRRLGVGRADRVALVVPNGPVAATAFLGISSAAACAPLNPGYQRSELDFYLEDLGARAVVVPSGAHSPVVDVAQSRGVAVFQLVESDSWGSFELTGAAAGAPAPEDDGSAADVALILHTSGTTARPKIVPLTHANLVASALAVGRTLSLGPDDRCLNVMPLFHIHGLVAATLASLLAGGSVVCTPGFVAPQFFGWASDLAPTWYTAVPTMHQAIVARAGQHSAEALGVRFRLIRSSSAALPPTVAAELERTFGAPVIEAYGMTEAAHQMASNPLPPQTRKPGSVGLAAGPEVAVLGPDGDPLPRGETGEVAVRGPNVTSGYENNPEANATSWTRGWFRTGDQGYLDADGYLYLTGRLKELINRGGEKISPREIDEVLLDHPAVAQAVAFAVPDDKLGEDVAAAVVVRPGQVVGERELREHCADRLAAFKVPRRLLLVDEIPKGPTGKVQRIGLARQLGLLQPRPAPEKRPYVAPRTPMERQLAEIAAELLGTTEIGVHDDFFDRGGDSVLAAQMVSRIRNTFGARLSIVAFFDAPTVAGLAALLAAPPTTQGGHAP